MNSCLRRLKNEGRRDFQTHKIQVSDIDRPGYVKKITLGDYGLIVLLIPDTYPFRPPECFIRNQLTGELEPLKKAAYQSACDQGFSHKKQLELINRFSFQHDWCPSVRILDLYQKFREIQTMLYGENEVWGLSE